MIRHSALINDWYQLTMSEGYWKTGRHETPSVFHLFFRKMPFESGFAIAAGLEYVVDLIHNFQFEAEDIKYLAAQGNFDPGFLEYLKSLKKLSVNIDAVAEGTVVFANEPLIRVTGPLLHCQLLETALLNIVNFQTLVATKAARIVKAAEGGKVAEFGLRRCQGYGGLEASRAAYIGGCDSTSNVLAGQVFGIPVTGTHAHSWVMSFRTEQEAFKTWCKASPTNSILLVDTYDVKQGIKNAIEAGLELRSNGHTLKGIRLDSGDLAEQSIMARKMLNEAGFTESLIVASGDLDEYSITKLKDRGAKIDLWGVGTNLVTSQDQPALGGVYKLGAIKDGPTWRHCMKFSETPGKATNPGILDLVRLLDNQGKYSADIIFDRIVRPSPFKITHAMFPFGPLYTGGFFGGLNQIGNVAIKLPMFQVMKDGVRAHGASNPETSKIREHTINELSLLDPEVLKLARSKRYPVGLEAELMRNRTFLEQANESSIKSRMSEDEQDQVIKLE